MRDVKNELECVMRKIVKTNNKPIKFFLLTLTSFFIVNFILASNLGNLTKQEAEIKSEPEDSGSTSEGKIMDNSYNEISVRVAILSDVKEVNVESNFPLHIEIERKDIVNQQNEKNMLSIVHRSGKLKIIADDSGDGFKIGNVKIYSKIVSIKPIKQENKAENSNNINNDAEIALISVNNKKYRGSISLYNSNGKMTVVNVLNLEEYLYGVVPKEMPCSWHPEALKAQAVACRTYTLSKLARTQRIPSKIFDLTNTIWDQVYGGYSGEDNRTNEAVDSTRGEILTYGGNPIVAYFHSNSGGHTEDDALVFTTDFPYIIGVQDEYSLDSPNLNWSIALSADELSSKLQIKNIENIEVLERSPTNRILKLRIYHKDGKVDMAGVNFRYTIGPMVIKSTNFTVEKKEDGRFVFTGKGSGHGVGMSQWGARRMAEKGFSYKEILKHYYPLCELIKM